jgi:S1-C subfamily serine protease
MEVHAMKHTLTSIPRAAVAAVLFVALAAAAGFSQPKAETKSNTNPDTNAVTSSLTAPGILVFAVQPGSPAEKAGIARGDIILQANGTAVNTPLDLERIIGTAKQGDRVSLKLQHGDATKTVSVTLGSQGGRLWIGIELGPEMYRFGMRGRGMPGFGMRGFGMPGVGPGMQIPAEGAYVESVVAGSPAEKAGLKQGDVILSVDGTAVDAKNTLGDLIAAKKVGDTITLSVGARGQSPRDVKVTLTKNPSKDSPYLGVQYAAAPQRPGRDGFGPGMMHGVFVGEVTADSPAAKAGIAARDIITKVGGSAVNNPQQVVDAVGAHKPGDSLALAVYSMADGTEKDLTVTLGQNPSDASKAWLGVSMSGFPGMPGFRGQDGRRAPFNGGQGQGPGSPSPSTPAQNPPNI